MQISKWLLVVCAAGLLMTSLPLRADTEAQIKARETLEKKLNELQAQPPQPAPPAPASVAPPPAAPAPQEQTTAPSPAQVQPPAAPAPGTPGRPMPPSMKPPPLRGQPMPAPVPSQAPGKPAAPRLVLSAPTPSDPEAIARARAALRDKMTELPIQPAQPAPEPVPAPPAIAPLATPPTPPPPETVAKPSPVPPATPEAAPPAAPAPAPAPVVQPSQRWQMVAPQRADPESIAKAREAMHSKIGELPPQLPAPDSTPAPGFHSVPGSSPTAAETVSRRNVKAPVVKSADARARKNAEKAAQKQATAKRHEATQPVNRPMLQGAPALQSMQGPASPLSADKQQKLADLLQRYQADQITPEQYHAQRAKILAEP